MHVTKIASPPLIASPVHEWPTLLTVLMQAQSINTIVLGPQRKTVISLDMALYMSAKKLQMARQDLNNLILRPGELHIVIAQLRTIGSYIENSGLDACWTEADIYGPATVKQIIDGKHVNRGHTAHLITLQALYSLYQQEFIGSESLQKEYDDLQEIVHEVQLACMDRTKRSIAEANAKLVSAVEKMELLDKMVLFDASHDEIPLFKVMRHYMKMVMEMLAFIRSVRTGDWALHLKALEVFTKFFFAHDRINYARMIPLYLAEMARIERTDPEIYTELLRGNWVVNKNEKVSFCALGGDNGLEQVNRSMKVSGGLVGITLNPTARAKFFLIAPELAQLAEKSKELAGTSSNVPNYHHSLTAAVLSHEEKEVNQLIDTIKRFTNPFTEKSKDLFNLVTKKVLPEQAKNDLCKQDTIGKKLFTTFVEERIKSNKVNIWSRMKKYKLLTWKSATKVSKVSVGDKLVELREDRSLFARMMMVCKSRRDINIQEAVGMHEFSVVPRSLFAPDGTMLHCSSKSVLMGILEKLGVDDASTHSPNVEPATDTQYKVVLIDGMAELQSLKKPEGIKDCSQLAEHFCSHLFTKYTNCNEMRLIFDRYDIPMSLKEATRKRRQGHMDPVYYRITETTHIAKVPLKRLLSHNSTKMELTSFLAVKALELANGKRLVVAWGNHCQANFKETQHLQSSQEEADTKLLLHAIDATADGATEIEIHSPDTDVFVLSLRRYPELCVRTSFVTGTGQHRRKIPLKPIVQALGLPKTLALPGFHALSGADNTGAFSGKGKLACFKALQEADQEILTALTTLGTTPYPSDDTLTGIEKFVCKLYFPKTTMTKVQDLRWFLFKRKQAQSERLPPTKSALYEAILRAHYQAMVWNSDSISNPELPSPEGYGWRMEEDIWVPFMTSLPPAPEAIVQLVKCGCSKERCSNNRCQCFKYGLSCTDLCKCSDGEESCDNTLAEDCCHDDDHSDHDDFDDINQFD